MQLLNSLYIANSPLGGRGVFTSEKIDRGQLIEVSPVLVLQKGDRSHLDKTALYHYYFIWGVDDETCAIALGYGSLYNHSYSPNAEYEPDYEANQLSFYAFKDIQADSEITVNYSGQPEGKIPLWFSVKERGN